jgi:CheY-like chemotaxis protein
MDVFIVEDEEMIIELYRDILEMRGHTVSGTASTGEEAIEKFKGSETKPDLIMMDHRMPGMGGLDAARIIMGLDPDTRIILVSADDNAVWEALKLGIVGMRKPLNVADLLSAIDVVVPVDDPSIDESRSDGSRMSIHHSGLFLIDETHGVRGIEIFKELVSNGYDGIAFSRKHPDKLRSHKELKGVPTVWFTSTPMKDHTTISPINIQKMLITIRSAFSKKKRTVAFVWGFEYVITNIQFERALNLIQVLNDRVMSSEDAIIIFSMDLDVLDDRQKKLISREFEFFE